MIWKLVNEGEVYLFYNGELIYKKWLNYGYSRVFGLHGRVYGRGTIY